MDQFDYSDITPLPLVEPNNPVTTILYSDEYKNIFGHLAALLAAKEYSERAYALTNAAIEQNAAHYTVWQYRFKIVVALGKDLEKELDWLEEIALDNVKNYQIWNYRQLLIKKLELKSMKRELPLLETMLDEDSKNYHVWGYRKWVVSYCGDYSNELAFVNKLIKADVYNNSAWSHRYFAVVNLSQISDFDFDSEVQYVKENINLAPNNYSSWNYLIGIHEYFKKDLTDLEDFVNTHTEDMLDTEVEGVISKPGLELLVKILTLKGEKEKAAKGLDLLASKYDTIRVNYWNYQKSLLSKA
ncbi:hypothetical protein WICPIJ_008013 [Wickerhamomyces pijperi]|uniref:Protein farnesyltransferase/geranylgeranyltransferase type-1 subunit alpha n=1 Tax=Wickerhamomyces pijperi TaxID=599730 RepID=A0A9P8TJI6_WICPI|nr:hypothetical protein WICPIJ_008013 [Wickerhamomyces pijperi]